jgi:endonuclease/exonuclease/phosphatase family metal-dependent hydrolase
MINLVTLNCANYDDHPGWLDRLSFIAQAIAASGANLVCLTEVRYTASNLFNSYAPQFWTNAGVAPPPDPASMADQIMALLNAGSGGGWTLYTDISDQYAPEQWEGLTTMSTLSMSEHGTFTMQSGDGNQRLTQYVNVTTPGGNVVTVYNTHLALDASDRLQDANDIIDFIAKSPGSPPFLIVGDMNATPDDPAVQAFASAGYLDSWPEANPSDAGFTFPANNPGTRIDYVWAAPQLAPSIDSVVRLPASSGVYQFSRSGTVLLSDHLGLQATFGLP